LSRGIRHAIFLTRSDRTRLLSLTGHPNCRAICTPDTSRRMLIPFVAASPTPEAASVTKVEPSHLVNEHAPCYAEVRELSAG
jgi:hypothetical protein